MLRLILVAGLVALLAFWQEASQQQRPQTHNSKDEVAEIANDKNNKTESKIKPEEKGTETQVFNYQTEREEKQTESQSGVKILGMQVTSDWVMVILTLALVLLTFAYVVVAYWQVQTARDTERAWVIATPTNNAPFIGFIPTGGSNIELHLAGANKQNAFSCSFKNTGNTPARLLGTAIRYQKVDSLKDVPKEPDYGPKTPLNNLPLVREDSIGFTTFLEPNIVLVKTDADAVWQQKAFLCAFGVIVYRDVYSRLHTTKFGYVYHFPQGGDPNPAGFRREGLPPAYNEAT